MNDIYLDNNFMNSSEYKEFINRNPGKGNLKIRAYAASEALPVADLNISVSAVINNQNVIFFSGKTDASGMIETISLPAPLIDPNNLIAPSYTTYKIVAGGSNVFSVNMYDGICVIQTINYVPGDYNGN